MAVFENMDLKKEITLYAYTEDDMAMARPTEDMNPYKLNIEDNTLFIATICMYKFGNEIENSLQCLSETSKHEPLLTGMIELPDFLSGLNELLLDNKDYGYITDPFNSILEHFKDAGKYGTNLISLDGFKVI